MALSYACARAYIDYLFRVLDQVKRAFEMFETFFCRDDDFCKDEMHHLVPNLLRQEGSLCNYNAFVYKLPSQLLLLSFSSIII